jgi:hypothetical protein
MTAFHINKVPVKCSVEWCEEEAEVKGMCRNHYHTTLRSKK